MNLLVFMVVYLDGSQVDGKIFPYTFLISSTSTLIASSPFPRRIVSSLSSILLFSFLLPLWTFQSQFSFSLVSMQAETRDIIITYIFDLCCSTRSHVSFKHLNFSCSLLQQNRDYFSSLYYFRRNT